MPFDILTSSTDTTAVSVPVQDQVMNLIETYSSMSSSEIFSSLLSTLTVYGGKLLLAILVYFVGRWLIRRLLKFIKRIFDYRNTDKSIAKFTISLINIVLLIFLILMVVGILGFNTTSFLAIFASAGLAVGMALSGTLQNFAGGVMILTLRPYKIGDFIEAQGYTGTVKEISLFSTLLNTVDNKMVIIPNGGLSTGIINNYSKESKRRVDFVFGVSYGTDYDKVKATILDVVSKHSLIHQDGEIFVALSSLSDSSVDVTLRVWTNSENYWAVYFDITETIYKRFNADGIEFPFPQMDIHLDQKN